jgi:K+-sensing histidine kinase KdpD
MDEMPPTNVAVAVDQPAVLPEPNPITMARHHREVLRQITVPFVIGLAVFLVVVLLAWLATGDQASVWADISTMFLVSVLFLMFLIITALAAALGALTYQLVRLLPPYTRRVQDYSELATYYAQVYSDKTIAPIVKTQATSASVRAFWNALFPRRRR